MCSHVARGKGGRKRWRKIRRALLLDRALRQELSLERVRDLLLGRALRKLRDAKRFDRLGSACWSDYVSERLGCELRWAQYLVRVDLVLERFPELRTAAVNGMLTPLKIIHLSRLFARGMSEENRKAAVLAATVLSVRDLETQVRQALAKERAEGTLSSMETEALALPEIENPWDPGPGNWLSFPASPRALTLFEAAVEAVNRFAGEDLPRHACLEYMVADRFSAIGWPTDMDETVANEERLRANRLLRAEERARATLSKENEPFPGLPNANRWRRERLRQKRGLIDGEYLRHLLPPELDPDSTDDPHDLDRIVRALEALDRDIRCVLGELLEVFDRMECYKLLGWESLAEYCRESLGLDHRRATRLIQFHQGLDHFPELDTAYRKRRLSYLQVLQLLKVVVPETVERWIDWAAHSSMRHTREVIDKALILQLPGALPEQLADYARLWKGSGDGTTLAPPEGSGSGTTSTELGRAAVTTFAPLDDTLPIGVTLPPPPGSRNPILVGLTEASPEIKPVFEYPFRLFLPVDVADFIRAGFLSCRDENGLPLLEGDALAVIASQFLENLDDPEIQQLRERFPVLERDGWRCTVPTCTRRAYLHGHHIRYRSDCGPDEPWNLTTLCYVHHIGQLHGSFAAIYVSGTAPDKLVWEIGRRRGKRPLLTFHGDRRVDLPEEGADEADSDLRDKLQAAISAASRARSVPPHSPDRAPAHV